MERIVAASIAVLCVLFVATPAAATPAATTSGGFTALGPQNVHPDQVELAVDVAPNGTATWAVTYRMRLETANKTAAFRDLQRDVRNNTSAFVDPFRRRIRASVATARNATGRSMNATEFAVSTGVQSYGATYGVVTYRFTWNGFAAVDGRRVRAGDAIAGIYLDSNTTLVLTGPNGYAVSSVSPRPTAKTNRSVRWRGELAFTPDGPHVTFAPASSGPAVPWPAAGGVLAALVVAMAGLVWYRRRSGERTAGPPAAGGGGDGPPATGSVEDGPPDLGDADGAPAADREPPVELLSNEELVTRFLREQGGRARQQELVAETGWTEAKTSQVVSGMRDSGDLESFRIGRENVLRLPEAGERPDDGAADEEGEDGSR